MVAAIYKFTNKVNGRVYIGQTKSITTRLRSHLKANNKCQFKQDVDLYGWSAFRFEVLEFIDDCDNIENALSVKEQYYIDIHIKMGLNFETMFYNKVLFVEKGGYVCEEEHKQKMSKSRTGVPLSMEHKASIGVASKERDSSKNFINHRPTSINISKALRKRSINILRYSLDGDFIKEYETQGDAALDIGMAGREYNINKALKGVMLQAFGYQWRYKTDNFPIKIQSIYRKIRVLDYNKNLIGVFNSPLLAAEAVGIDCNRVSYALNYSKYGYSQGFYFYDLSKQ